MVGGGIGLILVRRYKKWAMIVPAELIGGLIVTRGLTVWLPVLQGALGTLLVLVLARAPSCIRADFSTRMAGIVAGGGTMCRGIADKATAPPPLSTLDADLERVGGDL